ncbi:MAG TPA: response regulator [Acidobacteriaceae bacterium]|nr:response regulator [Acidobacteriaceae bacterium]
MKGIGVPRGILIVDDDPAITESLSAVFERHGYEVRCAHSAETAIEIIAWWEPDLAILDVMLPCMNGIDLALVLKANRPACHLVLFSGHAGTQALMEEAARKGSMFEILSKPVHPLFMLDFVASLFADVPKRVTGT